MAALYGSQAAQTVCSVSVGYSIQDRNEATMNTQLRNVKTYRLISMKKEVLALGYALLWIVFLGECNYFLTLYFGH
jgi:hypothetical protein